MKYKTVVIISNLILILMLLFIIIGFTIGYEEIKEKQPCVDGDGDINLEGIMCEKTTSTVFGYDTDVINLIIFIICLSLFLWNFICFFAAVWEGE